MFSSAKAASDKGSSGYRWLFTGLQVTVYGEFWCQRWLFTGLQVTVYGEFWCQRWLFTGYH